MLDEEAYYEFLVEALYPGGLTCPACGGHRLTVHRAHRDPVLDHRCACGRIFNAWTGTALQGTQCRPSALVLIIQGIAQGTPTARLARELDCSRYHLLELRHRLQHLAWVRLSRRRLPDAGVEADELFQNAEKKGKKHSNPDDPPQRRANKVRESGLVQLWVVDTVSSTNLREVVSDPGG